MKNITGFTIIELLCVMAVIVMLAGIGIPAYISWQNRGKIAEASATIAKIEMALEMYKTDNGSYPQKAGVDNLNANGLVKQFLVDQFLVSGINCGPYMQFKGTYDASNALLDPWGIIYGVYTAPGSVGDANFRYNTNLYYICSFGPDKTNNTADDIDNFKK